MGTRGAVGFVVGNKIKVSYNHFDSYPEGLGKDVVEFLRKVQTDKGLDTLKANAEKLVLVDQENKPTPALIKKYIKYADEGVASQSLKDWYCLLRNAQGVEGLSEVYQGNLEHMIDSNSFLKDSLFCEYAYIVDVDKMQLDLFVGFQREAQDGPNPIGKEPNDDGYYPVRYLGSIDLTQPIPDDWDKPFKDWEKKKEEAEQA